LSDKAHAAVDRLLAAGWPVELFEALADRTDRARAQRGNDTLEPKIHISRGVIVVARLPEERVFLTPGADEGHTPR
jgi:hypothetical protein